MQIGEAMHPIKNNPEFKNIFTKNERKVISAK